MARQRRGNGTPIDPWYDYLALPIAPLVLVIEFAALFIPQRRRDWR